MFALDDDKLVLVTTDRLSAYDVVLADPIPDRGRVLTQMTAFWLDRFDGIVAHHLLSVDDGDVKALPRDVLESLADADGDPEYLLGRTMICRRAEMLPIEAIVRGYLYGSAWREYRDTGQAVGLDLPAGMKLAEQLPRPAFTPSTKAEIGLHDENIDMARARELAGAAADEVAALSLDLYGRAAELAAERGIIIADTKFEFGTVDGRVALCDEVLTPDSSRFWYTREWTPGQDPPALDKQFVRTYLDGTDWPKTPPPPALPADVVAATRARYVEVYEALTASKFPY
ncbi:MAG: phosphoribosylaminoimidazolesuccinocarboxamide synthase [Acidimicrobiia bacterium]|nr:phosphoribosylaminoimidazolesuccinocarboxamide synthase [Acidimicrobiia bacterium]